MLDKFMKFNFLLKLPILTGPERFPRGRREKN